VPVRALELCPAVAKRLHLGAREREARLVALEQVVLVPGLPVLGDQLLRHHATGSAWPSQERSSTRNRGSTACGSGYSRYSTAAPASSRIFLACRPNSTGMMGSKVR